MQGAVTAQQNISFNPEYADALFYDYKLIAVVPTLIPRDINNSSVLMTNFCLNSFVASSPASISQPRAQALVPRSPSVHQAITYPRAAYKHCRSGAAVGRCGRHLVNTSTRHDHDRDHHASRPQLSVTQTSTTNHHEKKKFK